VHWGRLHTHSVLLLAWHLHLRYAADGGDALRRTVSAVSLTDAGECRDVSVQEKMVNRPDSLSERRGCRHGRRAAVSRSPAIANSLPGPAESIVASREELEVTLVVPGPESRGHLIDAGDRRELFLEGSRYRCGLVLRARPGSCAETLVRGEIVLGPRENGRTVASQSEIDPGP